MFSQGTERTEEAFDGQSRDPEVLPVHEGGKGRTGRCGVREDLRWRGVWLRGGGCPSPCTHGHYFQPHRQTCTRPQTGQLVTETSVYAKNQEGT